MFCMIIEDNTVQHLAQVSLCKKNNTGIRGVLNVKKSENNLKIPFFLSSDQRSDNVAPEFPKFSDLFRAYIGNYFLLLSLLPKLFGNYG